MLKKTLLSAAIASTFALSGCLDDTPSTGENAGAVTNPDTSTAVYPIFSPAESKLPIPNDLIFQQADATTGAEADGTFEVGDTSPPVTTALNELSGASTSAPIDIALNGLIDESTVVGPEDDPLTQNVFLIELTYASREPVRGLALSEPSIPATAGVGTDQPTYSVEVLELDGASTIRINPEEPLDPNTRYIAVLTNSIQDIYGEPIQKSPGAAGYKALSDASTTLAGALAALTPIQSLITRLWEPSALAFINNVDPGVGPLRGVTPTTPVGNANIAISYSFTTSNDANVLTYMADPAQWVSDSIESLVALGAVEATLTANPAATFLDTATAVGTAKATWDPTSFNPALGSCATGDFACAGYTVVAGLEGGAFAGAGIPAGEYFPDPKARTVSLNTGAGEILDINQVSALMSNLNITPGTVSVTQGTIEVPYFLDEPGTGGAGLVTGSWEADSSLATILSGLLPTPLPQRDPDISAAVNGIFPFADEKSTQTVPILAVWPTAFTGTLKTVIFQHGITTDRSAALAFGASLVKAVNTASGGAAGVAVIAIDQPLHGIGGFSTEDKEDLATTLLDAASLIDSSDGIDATEQATIDAVVAGTFNIGVLQQIQAAPCAALAGLTLDGTVPADIATAASEVLAGNCGPTATTQYVSATVLESTVAKGGSTIPGLGIGSATERHFGFTADANQAPTAMDFDGAKAANGSGSLFINLGNFLASRDNLRQGTMDLLNLRASLGNIDVNGAGTGGDVSTSDVYFIGHSLGTVNGIPFVKTTEATNVSPSKPADDDLTAANFLTPGGNVTRLIESSPSFGPTIIGGLGAQGVYQDSTSFQAFLNVLQATVDSADAINFVDGLSTPSLFSVVVGDTTIPNDVTTNIDIVPSLPGTSSIAPLAGSEPLVDVSGADANVVTGAGANALTQNVVRYTEGFHGTPVFPSSGTTEEGQVFTEMVTQAMYILLSSGASVTSTDASVIQ